MKSITRPSQMILIEECDTILASKKRKTNHPHNKKNKKQMILMLKITDPGYCLPVNKFPHSTKWQY